MILDGCENIGEAKEKVERLIKQRKDKDIKKGGIKTFPFSDINSNFSYLKKQLTKCVKCVAVFVSDDFRGNENGLWLLLFF